MAQVIPFPGTALSATSQPPQGAKKAKPEAVPSKVVKIRRAMRMPKANRPEDNQAIAFARIAEGFEADAYALAQTEPGSAKHVQALHMTSIRKNLPRNNLRIFTTPEDVVQGLWKAHLGVGIANTEWLLADLQCGRAIGEKDEDAQAHWTAEQDAADARLWLAVERLLRIPATSIAQFQQYKTFNLRHGVGNREWLRTHKPELAAIMDDELAHLEAEKAVRSAKRKGRGDGEASLCRLYKPAGRTANVCPEPTPHPPRPPHHSLD
jgi:hypothetical protein